MLWLGIDFETTGLNVKEDLITEVGAVLWDPEARMPIKVFHEFVKVDKPLTPEITKLTGLTDEILNKYGKSFPQVIELLADTAQHCTHFVAHNGTNFDKPLFENECARHKLKNSPKPWIDTSVDVPYPPSVTVRKLTYLAAEHGLLNPFAHRAVFDVMTMLMVLSEYDHKEILRYSESPAVTIQADVSYAERTKASSRGYRWEAETKRWLKTIKQFQLKQEQKEAMFNVIVLQERTA